MRVFFYFVPLTAARTYLLYLIPTRYACFYSYYGLLRRLNAMFLGAPIRTRRMSNRGKPGACGLGELLRVPLLGALVDL